MAKLNRGINYRPDIDYRLDKVPPSTYRNNITKPEGYFGSELAEESIKKAEINLDFLIKKAEKNLSKYNGFDGYKSAAVKKHYCKQLLNSEESTAYNEFESKLNSIDGDIVIDIYPRLLNIKSDFENDKSYIDKVKEIEINVFKSYSQHFVEHWEIPSPKSNLYDLYDMETKSEHYNKLYHINEQINNLKNKIEKMQLEKREAIKSKDIDKASYLDKRIRKAEADIENVRNRVSYTASEAYALHKKAQSTNNYLTRIGYNLLVSPLDNLDGMICCLIKLLMRQLEIEDDVNNTEEFLNNIDLNQLKKAINSLRGLLTISFHNVSGELKQIEQMLINMLMAPVKVILTELINLLRKFEIELITNIEGLFSNILDSDLENPENILDCLYFEGFADFIYDEIESLFNETEKKILDLYKFVYQQIDLFDEDSICIGKKAKLQSLYGVLSKLSNALETFDGFSLNEGLDQWVESFLIKSGFGTKYNHKTGQYEMINLQGCVDPVKNNNRYNKFMPEESDDLNTIDLSDNEEFQEYKEDYSPITYTCDIEQEQKKEEITASADSLDQKLKEYESA